MFVQHQPVQRSLHINKNLNIFYSLIKHVKRAICLLNVLLGSVMSSHHELRSFPLLHRAVNKEMHFSKYVNASFCVGQEIINRKKWFCSDFWDFC